jgi:hypothetical protein
VRPRLLLSELGRLLTTNDLASATGQPGPNNARSQTRDPRKPRPLSSPRGISVATRMQVSAATGGRKRNYRLELLPGRVLRTPQVAVSGHVVLPL